MPLPEPTTRSPGKLVLVYGDSAQTHTTSTRFEAGVDITTVSDIRTLAQDFGNVVKGALASRFTISAWRIADPDGATLYEEGFTPVLVGAIGPSGLHFTYSFSKTLIGKGTAATVGEASGSGRTVIFPGLWDLGETVRRMPTSAEPEMGAIRTFLITTLELGADFYGQPLSYKDYVDLQFNSHWQQKLGF